DLKARTTTAVRAAATRVGLESLLDRRPAQLSGGQQQRVALARAIVRNPAAYLMDEPLSNLDAQLRLQTRSELKRLHRELGTTTVYVTHDQAEAMTLAGRIALMQKGRIVQVGAPLDLSNDPANRGGSACLSAAPTARDGASGNGGRVAVGVRPADVQVSPAEREGWQRVGVRVTEPMGSESLVSVERDGPSPARVVART